MAQAARGVECSPLDGYGVTKLAATRTTLELSRKWGLRTSVFDHSMSSGRAPEWSLLGAAIGRLIMARREGSDVVPVGRTDTYRDFVAVDDVVDAVLKVAESDLAPGVVNVCSGTPTRVGDVLAILAGVSGRAVTWRGDPGLVRPDDIESCIGDPAYARDCVGFSARVSLTDAIEMAWRHRASDQAGLGKQE